MNLEKYHKEFAPVLLLSRRQLQIFEGIGDGQTIKEIANTATYHVSVKTVETHIAHLKRKLNMTAPKLRCYAARFLFYKELCNIEVKHTALNVRYQAEFVEAKVGDMIPLSDSLKYKDCDCPNCVSVRLQEAVIEADRIELIRRREQARKIHDLEKDQSGEH